MPARIVTIQCPTGGWNTRDPFDKMKPEFAVQLDNMFPGTANVTLRMGHAEHSITGYASPVGTLVEWSGGATSVLLAGVAGRIIDVSTSVPASLASGYSSDIWSTTNFSTAAGQYVLGANDSGADVPWVYDGATVAPVVVTGIAGASLSQVMVYQQRVFYTERNSLSVWYTAAGAFQGALTEFDFGGFCTRGGSIAQCATWTRDNGFGGVDDLFIVVTTKGELLVYIGPNPSVSTTWSMQGRFVLGEPVKGPRCMMRTGPDLMLICADGFQPLSSYLTTGESRAEITDLARYISSAASDAVKDGKSRDYWGAILWPDGDQLIVNVPIGDDRFHQYVANTTTGAWCRYTELDAYSWARFNDAPYFGGADGIVYRFGDVPDDDGDDVVGEFITAFSALGMRGRQKRAMMLRPTVETNGSLVYSVGVNADYRTDVALPVVSSNVPTGSLWDSALWDVGTWTTDASTIYSRWTNTSAIGYMMAVHFKVATKTLSVSVNGFDIAYETGGAL